MENFVFPDEIKQNWCFVCFVLTVEKTTFIETKFEEHFSRPLKIWESAASCMSFHWKHHENSRMKKLFQLFTGGVISAQKRCCYHKSF